jgi:hypothetical protein
VAAPNGTGLQQPKLAQAAFHRVVSHSPRFVPNHKHEATLTAMTATTTNRQRRRHAPQHTPHSHSNNPPRKCDHPKFCNFHQKPGHTDDECLAQKKKKAAEKPRSKSGPPARQYATMIVPDEEDDDLIETVNGLMTVKDRHTTDSEILLDNGAEISLFRDAHLLTDITPTKSIRIRGVNSGDKALLVTHTAMFRGLLQVYYSKDATANILSYCQVGDNLGIVWDSERQLFHTTDHELTFVRDGKLFVLTDTKCVTFLRSKPVVKNDLVREVQRRLGFPSESTLAQAIRNGAISNLPITVKDVETAVSIEGRSAATLQGKAQTCNSP